MRINPGVNAKKMAETLAITGLSFLASDPERLDRFLTLSGLSPGAIREVAADPSFLAAVLDHICQDEAMLTAFAAESQHGPQEVDRARQLLGGQDWERESA